MSRSTRRPGPRITASVGAAWLDDAEPQAAQRLYDAADAALHEAKMAGRNCIVTAHAD